MALPTTKKQCDIRIKSLKNQVAAMEKRKKSLSTATKKKTVKKKVVKRKVAKKVVKRKTAKKATKKKRR